MQKLLLTEMKELRVMLTNVMSVQRVIVDRLNGIEAVLVSQSGVSNDEDAEIADVDTQELGDRAVQLPCNTMLELTELDERMEDADVQHYVVCTVCQGRHVCISKFSPSEKFCMSIDFTWSLSLPYVVSVHVKAAMCAFSNAVPSTNIACQMLSHVFPPSRML